MVKINTNMLFEKLNAKKTTIETTISRVGLITITLAMKI